MAQFFACNFPRRRPPMRDFPLPAPISDELGESTNESKNLPKLNNEPFCFINADHSKNIFNQFCQQREEGLFVDCTVITENEPILAHQTILAAVIPYFDRLFRFKHDQEHSRELPALSTVDLSDLEPKSVAALVDYAYRGEIVISLENVQDLLPAADFLCIEPVSTACVNFLCKNLCLDTWLSILQFASSINNFVLTNHVKRFILRRFSEIKETENFLRIDSDILLDVLRNDELIVTEKSNEFFLLPGRQEELILNSVLRYASSQSDRFENEELLTKFLSECVRLPLMSVDVLNGVRCNELFAASEKCLAIIDKAILLAEPTAVPSAPARVEQRKSSAVETLLLGCVTGSCSQGSLSVSMDSVGELEESSEARVNEVNNSSSPWTEPRSLTVLRISLTKGLAGNDVWGNFPDQAVFDDSSLVRGKSVLYTTGMKLFIRSWDGHEVIGGMLVTYSNNKSVLHGGDNFGMEVEEFTVAPDERITAVYVQAGVMIDALKFTTNKGTVFGPYGGAGGGRFTFTAPARTGYLAYVKGKVQFAENGSTIRHLQFAWAYNSSVDSTSTSMVPPNVFSVIRQP